MDTSDEMNADYVLSKTWPVNEQIIDIVHKTVYAFVTGYFTDKWLQ